MIFEKVIDSGGGTTGRAGTCGEGKGRGKPLPKELGDLGFSAVALHASRHKASADFIENPGHRLQLLKRGKGSYVMRVKLVSGEEEDITVDSGAEESVYPLWWAPKFGIMPSKHWLNLRGASGNAIDHYSQKDVLATSCF